MSRRCIAENCMNKNSNDVLLHAFPLENKAVCAKWIEAVKKNSGIPSDWVGPSSTTALCSAHFTDDCFKRVARRGLKPGAVPTIFNDGEQEYDVSAAKRCKKTTALKTSKELPESSIFAKKNEVSIKIENTRNVTPDHNKSSNISNLQEVTENKCDLNDTQHIKNHVSCVTGIDNHVKQTTENITCINEGQESFVRPVHFICNDFWKNQKAECVPEIESTSKPKRGRPRKNTHVVIVKSKLKTPAALDYSQQELDVTDEKTEENLCPITICKYGSAPEIQFENLTVKKRTPFLACRMCFQPLLNLTAMIRHIKTKHFFVLNGVWYPGFHICLSQVARVFSSCDFRSSDLPMEFRGMCWVTKCQFGCTAGPPFHNTTSSTYKPLACKVCNIAFRSVAAAVCHIEKQHGIDLLRHFIHICPEIYRIKRESGSEPSLKCANESEQTTSNNSFEKTSPSDKLIENLDKSKTNNTEKSENSSLTSTSESSSLQKTTTTDRLNTIQCLPESKSCEFECIYGCFKKDKCVRGIRMAHIMSCKECKIAYYTIGSFLNHMQHCHNNADDKSYNYLHICEQVARKFFSEVTNLANEQPVNFFRRWYFYDNCKGSSCEFGCNEDQIFACKVCHKTYSSDSEVIFHIETEHDRVSFKPLLHMCPIFLGNPPFGPKTTEANKYKAITHHSFVAVSNEVKNQATPIRPIKRKSKVASLASTNITEATSNLDFESPVEVTPIKIEPESMAWDKCMDGMNNEIKADYWNLTIKSEPMDSNFNDSESTTLNMSLPNNELPRSIKCEPCDVSSYHESEDAQTSASHRTTSIGSSVIKTELESSDKEEVDNLFLQDSFSMTEKDDSDSTVVEEDSYAIVRNMEDNDKDGLLNISSSSVLGHIKYH